MPKCSECGKATSLYQGDVPFCLDCSERYIRMLNDRLRAIDRQSNFIASMIELSVGLPQGSVIPRTPVIEPLIQGDNMTFNNINVDRSTIGVINTGNVKKLDVAIGHMQSGDHSELAEGLRKLTEAVLNSKELRDEEKEQAVDQLAFLAEEAATPAPKQNSSILKPIFSALGMLLTNADKLKMLWDSVGPMLARALSVR